MATLSITQPITGSYKAYYRPNFGATGDMQAGDYLGAVKANTLKIIETPNTTEINTDEGGENYVADEILTLSTVTVEMTLLEVDRDAAIRLTHPYSTDAAADPSPGLIGISALPGTAWSSFAGQLYLEPIQATGSANTTGSGSLAAYGIGSVPPCLNFPEIGLSNGNSVEKAFSADLLEIPFVLQAKQCRDNTNNRYYAYQQVANLNLN